jgi:hypothetical protein
MPKVEERDANLKPKVEERRANLMPKVEEKSVVVVVDSRMVNNGKPENE